MDYSPIYKELFWHHTLPPECTLPTGQPCFKMINSQISELPHDLPAPELHRFKPSHDRSKLGQAQRLRSSMDTTRQGPPTRWARSHAAGPGPQHAALRRLCRGAAARDSSVEAAAKEVPADCDVQHGCAAGCQGDLRRGLVPWLRAHPMSPLLFFGGDGTELGLVMVGF